jgi:hypothetical protein
VQQPPPPLQVPDLHNSRVPFTHFSFSDDGKLLPLLLFDIMFQFVNDCYTLLSAMLSYLQVPDLCNSRVMFTESSDDKLLPLLLD